MVPADSGHDDAAGPWRRNLWVCSLGSFTTIAAMTLLVPFLPTYVRQLGVRDADAVILWSGLAYSATFVTAGLTAPLWGALGDRYGRKLMLIRASLGMAVAMSLLGLAQSVHQLVALRLLVGLLGGYSSAATILVAAQTPKGRSAWALGVLSSSVMAGTIAGPLVGGFLPALMGIRLTFLLAGGLIFCAFMATLFFVAGDGPAVASGPTGAAASIAARPRAAWSAATVGLLATGGLLAFATMSVEPTLAEYVARMDGPRHAALWSGVVMSAGAAGAILSAPRVGRVADERGPSIVITACLLGAAACLVAQGAVASAWQLMVVRFLMGLFLGGLMPAVTSALRAAAPPGRVGSILGWSVSVQYAGQVLGPLSGGLVATWLGLRAVFLWTALVLFAVGMAHLWWRGLRPVRRAAPAR